MASTANATDWCDDPPLVETGAVYMAVDCTPASCHWFPFSTWAYYESNGEPGLQRGGVTLLGDADICQNSLNPDQGVI